MIKIISLFIIGIFLISLVSAEHTLPTDLVDANTSLMEGMGTWANDVTQGSFWIFLLLGFCIVLFTATVRYGISRALGYAGTAGLFGAIFLLIIGWMHWTFASMFIIVGAIGIAVMVKDKVS